MKSYALALIATSVMGATIQKRMEHDPRHGRNATKESDASQFDSDSNGKLDKDELLAYARSLSKENQVEEVWQHAKIKISTAEDKLAIDPYTKEEAYKRIRERFPQISLPFAEVYVEADYMGNQDYKTTYAEFYDYLNGNPDQEIKFDTSVLQPLKGAAWDTECVMEDIDFVKESIKMTYITDYSSNDPSTWHVQESDINKFSTLVFVSDDATMDLQDKLGEPTVASDCFDNWLYSQMSNAMAQDARTFFDNVDAYTGADGVVTVDDLINTYNVIRSPGWTEYIRDLIRSDDVSFNFEDDVAQNADAFAKVTMIQYIGPDRDNHNMYAENADKIVQTLALAEKESYKPSYAGSYDTLYNYLATEYLWRN